MSDEHRVQQPNPHRVLFVDHTPVIGGAELALAHHLRSLDRGRFLPFVACTDTVPSLLQMYRATGAEVHVVPLPQLRTFHPRSVWRLITSALRLRRLARRLGINLVVANTSRAAYAASVAFFATRTPVIWWVRDFFFSKPLFAAFSRTAARIICVSEAVRQFYRGTYDERFHVVLVGSDMHRDLPTIADAMVYAERARWGFTPEDLVVGYMARLVEDKGADDLIAAVADVHSRMPRVRLLLVGEGRGQTGDVEQRLKDLVASRGWSFVRFAGYRTEEALFYRTFDIFVHCSRALEAYPTSVVQAMMAGTPVVATDTGGTAELVRHLDTGLLTPPRAPRELAGAIEALAADPGLRARLAATARSLVHANNREELTTRRAEEIYHAVLGTTSPTSATLLMSAFSP